MTSSLLKWTPQLPAEAELCVRPHFLRERRRRTGAKAEGQRYERKIQRVFDGLYGSRYLPGPWFRFRETAESPPAYCQPDGLLFDPAQRRIVIVEIKLRHTPAAFEQLYCKYLPVVSRAFGGEELWAVCLSEVVRWYDSSLAFPVPIRLTPDPAQTRPGEVTVHICNPDRRQFKLSQT